MEPSLQEVYPEDQEIPAWQCAEEHNMLAYKGVGNKMAFGQQVLGCWLHWLLRW